MKILIAYLEEDEKLRRCLDSLKKHSPEIEVLKFKIDKSKTKICEEIFSEEIDKIDDDVMIWHPDMIALPNWYEELKKYYDKFDVIGTKLVYPDSSIQHFGGAIRVNGWGFHPFQHALDIELDEPVKCAYVTGPGTVIKKSVWEKVKWDLSFTYFIDVDFCFQAREAGFTVGVVPVKIVHEEGLDMLKARPKYVTKQLMDESYAKFTAKWMHKLSDYR